MLIVEYWLALGLVSTIVRLKSLCASLEHRSLFRAQSYERTYESRVMHSQKPLVCETSARNGYSHILLARSTQYECSLVTLYTRALVLAHPTRAEYTVRVLARYALRSRARNLASVHHACEWQRTSTRVTRVQGLLRRTIYITWQDACAKMRSKWWSTLIQ